MTERVSLRVAAGAVLVMFLWAVCFPSITAGLENSPPMAFAALRAVLSGAVLLIAAQWLHRPSVEGKSIWAGIVLVGVTATSLGFFGMFYGGSRLAPGLATVISNFQPLIAAGLAWSFLGERLSVAQRWGLAAGFAGIVLIGAPTISGPESELIGVFLILVGAVGIAISNVALKRLTGKVDVMRAMGWQLLIGAIPLALLAAATEDVTSIRWSWQFSLNLAALSVLGTSGAFVLWFSLLQRAKLSQLNVFTFLTPIFGLLMGVLFFSEQLRSAQLAGIALGLLGIYAVNRPTESMPERRRADNRPI